MSVVQPVFEEVFKPFTATVVIVLYRMAPTNSPAFQSIMEARNHLASPENVRTVLWDNSSETPPEVSPLGGVTYLCDPRNLGLATAYNRALELAVDAGSEWLVTLDQDTSVPPDYFLKMASAARASAKIAGVGSIVPQIQAEGKIVSPNHFLLGAIPRWYRRGFCGVPGEAAFAFNSGAMLSVTALQQIGGYDPWFWLDNSDAQTFSRLHQHGKRVYIAGDIQVQHDFSMKNMGERMSLERYRNALLAETAFWDLRMNWLAGLERSLRLSLRLIKHRKRNDNPELRKITRRALRRRLFMPKANRVKEWKEKTRERLGDALESSILRSSRLKISACMAAYNGGRFIDAQLGSILSQLGEDDEVLIVDDCSRDDTLERIAKFNDPRIRLLRHTKNSGVVETFEDALRSAKGDILFLCDDDDVWAPTKVKKFLNLFETRPDVEIVTSRVCLIDEHNVPLPNSRVNRGGKFSPGFWNNLIMNHYQGSAMAIRASVLGRVLPFPRRKLFLHDAWIGTRNEAAGGKTEFIDEDLLFYRRHPQNASRTKSLLRQVQTRLDLLIAHITHAFRLSTL
jgi:GT2 family glycosyltransferase